MKKQNIHINRAIQIPLLAILTLFILFTILVYNTVGTLYRNYQSLYRQSIPEIAHIMSIFDDFQHEYAKVYQTLNSGAYVVFLPDIINIQESITSLDKKIQEYNSASLYSVEMKNISPLLHEFRASLDSASKYLQASHEIAVNRLRCLKEIRYLSDKLSKYTPHSQTDFQFFSLLQSTMTHLIILSSEIPNSYSRKVNTVVLENSHKIEKLVHNPKMDPYLTEIYKNLKPFIYSDDSMFQLFLDSEEINKQRISLFIHLDVLYKEIARLSNNVFHVLGEFTEQENMDLDSRINNIIYFVFTSILLLLCFFYFIYVYLNKSIVKPLMGLNRFVKIKREEIAQSCLGIENNEQCGEKREFILCIDGAVEVIEITGVVLNFIREIEDREKKLRHSHENLEIEVKERTKEISALFNKIVSLQEDERFKLAAELHDDIGASLGIIKFSMERALRLLQVSHMGQATESLDESIKIVKSVARQLRRIQTDLRPPHLDVGLLKTLEWYVKDYRVAHPHIRVTADFFFDELMLSASLHIVTFRIIQEVMNNISKHSDADTVFIQILHEEDFRIVISDNGKGFSLEEYSSQEVKRSYGLKNIQERVTISGGKLHIESEVGKGTSVIVIWNNQEILKS